jgi:hypothetical protein
MESDRNLDVDPEVDYLSLERDVFSSKKHTLRLSQTDEAQESSEETLPRSESEILKPLEIASQSIGLLKIMVD